MRISSFPQLELAENPHRILQTATFGGRMTLGKAIVVAPVDTRSAPSPILLPMVDPETPRLDHESLVPGFDPTSTK
jgi:hypothetical protein